MQLLDHVSIAVSDLPRARRFYDAIMHALGADKVYDERERIGYGARCRPHMPLETYLTVLRADEALAPSKRHWCFKASSRVAVDAFHQAGLDHGGSSDGAPGLRDYHAAYYAAFLLDPDGNRVEAVCHLRE